CLGQAQDFRGSLAGGVYDSSGGRIPDAQVVLRAADGDFERRAGTGNLGQFRFDDLLPGRYRLTVEAKGLAPASASVAVVVSSVQQVKVTMTVAAERAAVSVAGEASSIVTEPLDVSSAVHGSAITAQDLDHIPLAHRSFANIAYLVPGTEP